MASPTRTKGKRLLRELMQDKGLTVAGLARLAGVAPTTVRRVLDDSHGSSYDSLERVARSMGRTLVVEVTDERG